MEGDNNDMKIKFTKSPKNPPLIPEFSEREKSKFKK